MSELDRVVDVVPPVPLTELPAWAQVSERRRAHIARVTALLVRWAHLLALPDAERSAWRDAGLLHDALRDAPEAELRRLTGDERSPVEILHGPAAAVRLRADGEARQALLDAIQWHTLGYPDWAPMGRALFMADYLEPGRSFARAERAFLAAMVPHDFDAVFREVLRHRLEWTLREGKRLHAETVALWNLVR
ncbi:MAG TPA: HD domain-containing protein [Gemmatimonadaceae bacterium]|nr:HD domain-containing protein [Gemmatimonadaceae bacterium]